MNFNYKNVIDETTGCGQSLKKENVSLSRTKKMLLLK